MKNLLSKDEVIAAFTLLGQRAAREGMAVELFVVGGFAIIAGHKTAEEMREGLTHDVDAVFVQPQDARLSKLRSIIGEIGNELGLPAGWLNDSASKFVTRRSDGPLVFESQGIIVRRATDLQLFGMKLGLSRRKTDLDDQDLLFDAIYADLQPATDKELWRWVKQYVPNERVESAKIKLANMWEQRHG